MQTISSRRKQQKRNGFSMVDFLVVFVVVGLLVALTLSAIPRSHGPAKKLTCLNNMRNIGLAVVNFSSGADSQLPLLVDPNIETDPESTRPNDHRDDLSWCITVLPFLDSVEFRQRWDETAVLAAQDDATAAQIQTITSLNQTRFPVFSCPDDQFSSDPGALSYVVNVGYVTAHFNSSSDFTHHPASIDGGLDGDATTAADIPAKFASGVFWRPGESRMSLDFISAHDGMTQTLMLSENLQAGEWSNRDTGSLGFGVDMQGVYSSGTETLALPKGFHLKNGASGTDSRISSNLRAAKGQAWRPSSNHPSGVVNVIMCDGSGKSLSPEMDAGVYARLLTPAGMRYGQDVVDESEF